MINFFRKRIRSPRFSGEELAADSDALPSDFTSFIFAAKTSNDSQGMDDTQGMDEEMDDAPELTNFRRLSMDEHSPSSMASNVLSPTWAPPFIALPASIRLSQDSADDDMLDEANSGRLSPFGDDCTERDSSSGCDMSLSDDRDDREWPHEAWAESELSSASTDGASPASISLPEAALPQGPPGSCKCKICDDFSKREFFICDTLLTISSSGFWEALLHERT